MNACELDFQHLLTFESTTIREKEKSTNITLDMLREYLCGGFNDTKIRGVRLMRGEKICEISGVKQRS